MKEDKKVKKELNSSVDSDAKFETIMKAQNEQIEVLKAQNEAVEKALKEEKDKRELSLWVTKAKKDLANIPGKTSDELAETLKALADVDLKLADTQFDSMKAASAAIGKSEMFSEIGLQGAGVEGDSSAWGQIQKIADGMVEKSGHELTKAAAISKALFTEKGKRLYDDYLSEHPHQTGNA